MDIFVTSEQVTSFSISDPPVEISRITSGYIESTKYKRVTEVSVSGMEVIP